MYKWQMAKSDLKRRSSYARRLTRRKLTCSKRRAREEKLKMDLRHPAPSMRETRVREGEHAPKKTNQCGGTRFAQGLIYSIPGVFSTCFHQIHVGSIESHVFVFFWVFFSNDKRWLGATHDIFGGRTCENTWRSE